MGFELASNLVEQPDIFSNDGDLTLGAAYQALGGSSASDIPFLVWLLENPDSPLALPGKISLKDHDCLHLLLNRGFSLEDEAFIIGFTMGNDTKTNKFHLLIFQLLSMNFYPQEFRFKPEHMGAFNSGFLLGKSIKIKNINSFNFSRCYSKTIAQTRVELGLA